MTARKDLPTQSGASFTRRGAVEIDEAGRVVKAWITWQLAGEANRSKVSLDIKRDPTRGGPYALRHYSGGADNAAEALNMSAIMTDAARLMSFPDERAALEWLGSIAEEV